MPVIKLTGFQGEIPRVTPRLLPETAAAFAHDARLESGSLEPYRNAVFVQRVPGVPNAVSMFRNGSTWLAWSKPVYCAPGPVASDRLYVMGDGAPKMIVGGVTYPLAVPTPAATPVATVSGTGSGDVYTRLYVYTWVTDFGEESAPSAVTNSVNWQSGQTVTISGFDPVPAGRAITKMRIYRSQSTLSGTNLYFIAERTASSVDFIDNLPLTAQNELLPSTDWDAPAANLTGLIALPNGMMAAFKGKTLCFCEPWRPHAWPQKYEMNLDYDIVGLGAFGTTVVVATTGQPYTVSGASPDVMMAEKLELNLPCVNARGLVDMGYAVAYPSIDGLAVISSSGARVITDQLMTRNDWLGVNPATLVASQYYGRYIASYAYTDEDGVGQRGAFMIDASASNPTLSRTALHPDAMWYDLMQGKLFMGFNDGANLDIYEFDSINGTPATLVWASKPFVLPKPANFGVILVEGDKIITPESIAAEQNQADTTTANNAALLASDMGTGIGGSMLAAFSVAGDPIKPVAQDLITKTAIYADGKLVAVINSMGVMDRLPGGFKARVWEVEVSTNHEITQIVLAGTGAELAEVA